MSGSGRITIPADVRRQLEIDAETELAVDVDRERGVLVLRPARNATHDDAWAYTPEHQAALARAHADVRAGRVRRLTEGELAALISPASE